jgi:4-amino-4-deoxy-L-arabinose transferase-like glycosyltransferase
VLAVSLAQRIPWRNADAGNAAFWTYGYFVTDEGYYTSGGRLALLTGHCLDPEMNEPPTFGAAPAMHYLSALSYRLRGLTYDACRLPTLLAGTVGWCSAYWLAASVTHPLAALAVTLPVSLNPLSLTYERASSSDAAVGGFLLLALALLRSRRRPCYLLGGLCFAIAPAVKATGVAFAPLVVLTTLAMPRRRWTRLGLGLLGFLLGWSALHGLNLRILRGHPSGLKPAQLRGACSMAAGALPRPSLQHALRAIPIFPRFPVDIRLGVFSTWILALPAWGLASHLARWPYRRLQRPALYAGMLLFAGALAIQIATTDRYFLPLIMLAPWLLVAARASVFRWTRRAPLARAFLLLAVCLIALSHFWTGAPATAGRNPGAYLTNEYNLPAVGAWPILGTPLVVTAALLLVALLPWRRNPMGIAGALLVALSGSLLFWHAWPMARLGGPYSATGRTAILVQQILLAGLIALMALPGQRCPWRVWYGALAAMFLTACCAIPPWRQALSILWQRPDAVRQAALTLERALPANSIVIGNRASSLLRASRLKLGFCTPNDSAPGFVKKVTGILEHYPDRPLFLLVDEDHSYHASYLQQAGQDKLTLRVAGSLPLPAAGGEGRTIRVLVVQLTLKP